MTHPADWTEDESCPSCCSWDITEYKIRVGAEHIRMGWECHEYSHAATWTAQPGTAPADAVTSGPPDGER